MGGGAAGIPSDAFSCQGFAHPFSEHPEVEAPQKPQFYFTASEESRSYQASKEASHSS
jgi:hypothetical protein